MPQTPSELYGFVDFCSVLQHVSNLSPLPRRQKKTFYIQTSVLEVN